MSVPLEILKQMGLTPEQLMKAQRAAEDQNAIESISLSHHGKASTGVDKHDELSKHLDRILNAPTGLSKFSTDPINRIGYLLPTEKPDLRRKSSTYLSKSMDNMAVMMRAGEKENKRAYEGGPSTTSLKKARSIESLNAADADVYRPVSATSSTVSGSSTFSAKSHEIESKSKRELYTWGQPAAAQSQEVLPSLSRRLVLEPSALEPAKQENKPVAPFELRGLDILEKQEFLRAAAAQEEQIEEPVGVQPDEQQADQPKQYSLNDLLQEFKSQPSATSSMQVEASPNGDKYDSFYDLLGAASEDHRLTDIPMDIEEDDTVSVGLSAIHSEPILRQQPAQLMSATSTGTETLLCDLLDDGPLPQQKPSFLGVFQNRFASKYGMSESNMTLAGSCGSIQAEIGDDELGKYPLLSPSYSALLREQASPKKAGKSPKDKAEIRELEDPATSALLQGVREEINAQDQALYLNYRNCMRHGHTSLPISFQEVKQKIEEYGLDISFKEEKRTSDVKQLFLLPLNLMTVPRWVPPGATFRVGRGSNWFMSQTRVVSRNHCEVFHDIHSYYVKDVGSKSGTFVNGTRLGDAETISSPKELKHGDILQVGVDFATERDPYGNVPEKFRSAQCIALYGYKAKQTIADAAAIQELQPTERLRDEKKHVIGAQPLAQKVLSVSDSKFERMARKASAMKSKLASANTRLYVEFGDYISENSAGTAVLVRPSGEPSYSFSYNNYRFTWDIGMTCRDSGKYYGLRLAADDRTPAQTSFVYHIFEGYGMDKLVAVLTVQGEHKCLLEPVYERNILEEELAIAESDTTSRLDSPVAQILSFSAASPYVLASSKGAKSPSGPAILCTVPIVSSPILRSPSIVAASLDAEPSTPRNPFYTLTGDLHSAAFALYIQRYQNSRKQVFLGEGQVSSKKSAWGKKTILYEARLPPAEQHDELLALASLFNVLNQMERL